LSCVQELTHRFAAIFNAPPWNRANSRFDGAAGLDGQPLTVASFYQRSEPCELGASRSRHCSSVQDCAGGRIDRPHQLAILPLDRHAPPASPGIPAGLLGGQAIPQRLESRIDREARASGAHEHSKKPIAI
jgi:hypothetical protein